MLFGKLGLTPEKKTIWAWLWLCLSPKWQASPPTKWQTHRKQLGFSITNEPSFCHREPDCTSQNAPRPSEPWHRDNWAQGCYSVSPAETTRTKASYVFDVVGNPAWAIIAINRISLLKVHEVSTLQNWLGGIVFGLDKIKTHNLELECHAPSQSRFQAKTTLPLVRSSFSDVYPKRFIFLAG